MLSLEKCKEILEKHGGNYTDEQVNEIRDILYRFGMLDYEVFKSKKLERQRKSDNLHPSTNEQVNHLGTKKD